MRFILLLMMMLSAGCGWMKSGATRPTAAKPMIDSSGWVPTGNDDLDTIATALLDFMKQGRMTNLVNGQRGSIVVNKMTNGPSDFIAPEQIQAETRRINLPPAVIESLQTRNAAQSDVTWIPAALPFFVADLNALPVDLREMEATLPTMYPNVFAAVWLWLPGYSEDSTVAIVRFTFAPTASGAIATYILVKDDTGKWRVINRNLKYLVEPQ